MKRSCLFVLAFYCWWLLLATPAQAQVKINEVYPQPLTGEVEWVEIINDATQEADLSGWVLEDLLASPKVIFTFPQTLIQSGEIIVASFSGQLNNGADGVSLKKPTGELMEQMSYASSSPGMSWALSADGSFILTQPTLGTTNLLPPPSPTPSASPSPTPVPASPTPSPIPSPTPTPIGDLSKLELVAASTCPKVGSEWLEWQNTGLESIAAIVEIRDFQDNHLPLTIDLASQERQKIYLPRSIFNNSGDEVSVFYEGQLLIEKKLPGCKESDQIFFFRSGDAWPIDEPSQMDSVDKTQSPADLVSVADSSLTTVNGASDFVFPDTVVAGLQFEGGSVLGETTISALLSKSQPAVIFRRNYLWLASGLICGGFFWMGLGIIEIYGQFRKITALA